MRKEDERLPDGDVSGGKLQSQGSSSGSSSIGPLTRDVESTERLEGSTSEMRRLPVSSPYPVVSGGTVGRYELVELLGSGGMGSVYRAHDPHLSRDIALKVLHPEPSDSGSGSGYRHRLLREAQVLAKLSHPNVVAAFDVGTFEHVVFVAMELIAGESLRTWLHTRRSVAEVLRVLIAAGRGLIAAHAAGVLHRDFKPANVMVSPDGRVRVVDFGLARSAIAGAPRGTLDAAAPEPGATYPSGVQRRSAESGSAESGSAESGSAESSSAESASAESSSAESSSAESSSAESASAESASAESSSAESSSAAPSSASAMESGQHGFSPSLLEGELTQTGMLMGTPGYIAPEQLAGEPADALSDQYSYAVTVFVALTRQKPPPMRIASLGTAGDVPLEWPREVPRRIRRIVERGLALRPADRHPSVAAMVDALERAIAPRRRSGAVVALALGAVMVVSGTLLVKARSSRVTCQVTADSFRNIWDPERREALRQALAVSGRPNASEAFELLASRLDGYEKRWLSMKQESCEATHVRGEQSEKVLALRNTCLDRRLSSAGAIVTAFSRPDPGAVDRAAAAIPDSVEECADTAALLGTAERLPADPELRERISRIEAGFPGARALGVAGRWKEAGDAAQKLLDEARATGHDPTIAQALRLNAFITYSRARTAEERQQGEAYLREAIPLAARAGDDRLVARASSYLFELLAYGQNRVQEAEAMLPHVDALVIRAGDHPEERLEVLFGQAQIMFQRRKYPEAVELYDRVIALSDAMDHEFKAFGATARGKIGEIYLELENYPEAVRRMSDALRGLTSTFGSHHPRILIGLANLALAQSKVDTAAARATVLDMRERAAQLPTEDWRAITIPFLEGQIREDSHECASALPFYRDALALFSKNYGPDATQTGDVHQRLGTCLQSMGQRSEAIAAFERALAIRRSKGSTPNVVARAAFELAAVVASGGRASDRTRAIALAVEARDLWRQDAVPEKVKEVEQWLAAHDPTFVGSPSPVAAHQ